MNRTLIVYRLGSLGDTVMALPCLNRIVQAFPDHRRIALSNVPMSTKAPSIGSILQPGGFIHDVVEYPYGTRSPKTLWSLASQLRGLRAEFLVYLTGGRGLRTVYRDLMFFRAAGIRRVIGAPVTNDLDKNRLDPQTGRLEAEASRLARCLAELGPIALEDPRNWDLKLSDVEHHRARQVLGHLVDVPFIVVNTGGKLPCQDWGDPNWQALLPQLSSYISAPLVFVGGIEDRNRAAMLSRTWGSVVLDTCGLMSPRETAALIQRGAMFIGHESGPMHVAAAAGLPCVAIFGGNNPPGKWFPAGDQHRIHYDGVDIRHIVPEAVHQSVLEVWATSCQRRSTPRVLINDALGC